VPKSTLNALAKDKAQLRQVLLYHVVKGRVTAAKVTQLTSAKTLQGTNVRIKMSGASVRVNNAKVVMPDVMASIGVIHAVDTVLIPK
jgi:uncharacterized surface protein with fasciclin (FAS1) repeats